MTREEADSARDLGSLVVPAAGALVETGDLWEPYYLSGPGGGRVVPVSEFLRDLQATGSSRRAWAEDPATGSRRDLGREEGNAFWAWAAIEVLRHTGIGSRSSPSSPTTAWSSTGSPPPAS